MPKTSKAPPTPAAAKGTAPKVPRAGLDASKEEEPEDSCDLGAGAFPAPLPPPPATPPGLGTLHHCILELLEEQPTLYMVAREGTHIHKWTQLLL